MSAATAGAEVKVTASSAPLGDWSTGGTSAAGPRRRRRGRPDDVDVAPWRRSAWPPWTATGRAPAPRCAARPGRGRGGGRGRPRRARTPAPTARAARPRAGRRRSWARGRGSPPARARREGLAQAPAGGGVEPRAHADAGGDQEHVRRVGDDRLGRGAQLGVVDAVGVQRQRRRQLDLGAAALQQGDLLVDLARGGHADAVAGQGPAAGLASAVPAVPVGLLVAGARAAQVRLASDPDGAVLDDHVVRRDPQVRVVEARPVRRPKAACAWGRRRTGRLAPWSPDDASRHHRRP